MDNLLHNVRVTQLPGEPDPVPPPLPTEGFPGAAAPFGQTEPAAKSPFGSAGQPFYATPGQASYAPYPQPPYGASPHYPSGLYGPPGQMVRDPALAEWWQRLVARIIDTVVLLVLVSPLYVTFFVSFFNRFTNLAKLYPTPGQQGTQAFNNAMSQMMAGIFGMELLIVLVAAALSFGYDWLQHGLWGQTIGKRVMGTIVVTADGHAPISGRAACGRAAVYALVPAVPVAGGIFGLLNELWLLWDPQRQCLHDKAARTVVVKKDMLAPSAAASQASPRLG